MTGNLTMMMKFRDLQVAEDIGKKAEFGWFDVEFTMYGCAYLDRNNDKMTYKISSNEEDIYDFIEKAAYDDIFPSKVETLSTKLPVPVGTKDLIAQDVKKRLAKELQNKYQKEFFNELYRIADEIQNNHAKQILWEEAEELEGLFDEKRLLLFEELINYSYSCRKIKKNEYNSLIKWLEEEKKNMNETTISKDVFEKTLYGTAYEVDNKMKYINNAQRGNIYREIYEAETEGRFVLPIYARTYCYNYIYRLSDAIDDYKVALRRDYDTQYQEKIKKIREEELELSKLYYDQLYQIETLYGKDATEVLKRYLSHWGCMLK